MKKDNSELHLSEVLLRILHLRLFIPLTFVVFIAIIGAGLLGEKNLEKHQDQVVQSVSHIVDYHLDHGERILDTIAKLADKTKIEDLQSVIKSTWSSYGYFENIYCLDKDKRITLMTSSNPPYTGVDIYNLLDFKQNSNGTKTIFSHPFISTKTGYPSIYLARELSNGAVVIGELKLNLFEKEIIDLRGDDFIFIMDATGTLIAHPSSDLVNQKVNKTMLNRILKGKANNVYWDNGRIVIGRAASVSKTGWVVVDQVSMNTFLSSYALPLVIAVFAMVFIWLALALSLRKQLKHCVIGPLEELTKRTHMLTVGSYNKQNILSSVSTSFFELNKLLVDFQFMSDNLQQRENAIRESEIRYHGLVDRLPLGIFRITLIGELLDINPMLASILAYPQEELIKVNILEFLSKSLFNSDLRQIAIENVCNINCYETQMKRHDGELIWVQIDCHIVYDYKGIEQFIEGTIQDITERKKAEAKIKEQQQLLIKAEKDQREVLEKSLIMKDEFISLISHEFKTPLNVIYSAIQLMECVYFDKMPERARELVGNIKQNTFRQLRLANNLLDITRMNSGFIKINMKNIDIVYLCKEIAQSVELYAKQKDVTMSFISNVASKVISIDEEKFERIVLNLISNAMKFTESGGSITVSVYYIESMNLVEIKVSDTGIGIPKEKQEIIFEKFGQVDNNLSRQAEGTGIGLSLVKLYVTALGGTIEVESELGEGSTFTVNLPAKEGKVENETEAKVLLDVDNGLVTEIKVQLSDIYL